jgi:hypothetical protein
LSKFRPRAYTLAMSRAIDEIIDFIAAGTTPDRVASFRPSEETKTAVAELIHKEKTTGLSPEEAADLNTYLQLEHIMRLAKARAHEYLSHE